MVAGMVDRTTLHVCRLRVYVRLADLLPYWSDKSGVDAWATLEVAAYPPSVVRTLRC
jgi:hypothetical protein